MNSILTRRPATIAFACMGFVSQAAIVSTVVDNGGTWTYNYTVDNTAGSFSVAMWSLDLAVSPDWNQLDVFAGGDVEVPPSSFWWIAEPGIPVSGVAAQDFLSLDPSEDVSAGATLAGFSFTSAFPPGIASYYEFDASGIDTNTGTVMAPVPEPAGVGVVLAMGLAGWTVLRRARRES